MKDYKKCVTQDKSITYYNVKFDEHYHSLHGAYSEALKKFVLPAINSLNNHDKKIRILDLPFGLGYNSLCAFDRFNNVEITAIEKDVNACFLLLNHEKIIENQWAAILKSLKSSFAYKEKTKEIELIINDARKAVKFLNAQFDFIFLDPFSPPKNPELWTFDFFSILYKLIHENGLIITYSSALAVRAAFLRAGFFVGSTPPVARKRGGTVAAKNPDLIKMHISDRDKYLLKHSTGKIPYRDKNLNASKQRIISYRNKLKTRAVHCGVVNTVKKCLKNKI